MMSKASAAAARYCHNGHPAKRASDTAGNAGLDVASDLPTPRVSESSSLNVFTASQRVLTDWGFGLRVTDSRSSLGTVLHIDFAFPLNARDQVKSSQFIIKSQASF